MATSVEFFISLTALIVGTSHLFRANDWSTAYARLHDAGRHGAFINGGLQLTPGAVILATLPWSWPHVLLTALGVLLVLKGAICFLLPDIALKSMRRGAENPRGFQFAGVILLAIGVWAAYCAWQHMAATPYFHGNSLEIMPDEKLNRREVVSVVRVLPDQLCIRR